uniref:Uncharacterized protein n=1 Tax=Arundo donax TaxID=35708 RepID=A0A0A9A826_ARUDO
MPLCFPGTWYELLGETCCKSGIAGTKYGQLPPACKGPGWQDYS